MADTAAQRAARDLRTIEAQITGRWGEGHINPTRERIEALLGLLGDPQRAYRTVHLTGTNGKTSTARMVDELLRGFGLRVGRFTSPHLSQLTERITVDGEPISDAAFVGTYRDIAPYIELVDARFDHQLSFFEVMVALGYAAFADAPVDVAVVEVGLGGTWDATNVIDADVAVVTPISLDHTRMLGDSVAAIAREKAGIIKPGSTAVLATQPAEAAAELLRRAVDVDAAVARQGLEFGVLDRRLAVGGQQLTVQGLGGVYPDLFLPLHGQHQGGNAACALAAVEAFFGAGARTGPLDAEVVRESFAVVRSPGRLEVVRSAPTVLVDAAHNPGGMLATVAAVRDEFTFRRLVGVVGMLGDKDVRGMLLTLEPVLDEIVVTEPLSSRALPVDELAAIAEDVFGPERVHLQASLDDAIDTAIRLTEDGSDQLVGAGVLITGSVVTAGQARVLLGADR